MILTVSERLVTNCLSHGTAHKLHGAIIISHEAQKLETQEISSLAETASL